MNNITVYSYDPDTGRFDGRQIAYEDPLEKGCYMLPANSTTIRPPKLSLEKNQFIVWKDGSWHVESEEVKEEPEEIKPTIEELWEELRRQRKSKLKETDYLLLEDSPLTPNEKEKLKIYRQLLRDLPSNTVDPENPIWPEKPF